MTTEAAENLLVVAKKVLPLLKGLLNFVQRDHDPDLTQDLWGPQAYRELQAAIKRAEQSNLRTEYDEQSPY